ncbi:MAG TPA: ribbon-helix-helix domain-containing protein [Mycobacterium sp.]|nr:ribbon-helix-helix domain-containing protein [Mycobacterium sp.]HTX97472.1 ribbon-helix-helix domain-containing protein [Mycobacterium sp.]
MKLSVSLSDDDVAALDAYVKRAGLPSRSAGLHHAVQMLRHPDLEDDYAEAWAQWSADEGSAAWEGTVGDGVTDAAR